MVLLLNRQRIIFSNFYSAALALKNLVGPMSFGPWSLYASCYVLPSLAVKHPPVNGVGL
jgi:hypothetical protein